MSTPQEYVEFLMSYRLPYDLKLQLKMVLQNHFEEESGQWIRRQLDRIQENRSNKILLPGMLHSLENDWRRRRAQ